MTGSVARPLVSPWNEASRYLGRSEEGEEVAVEVVAVEVEEVAATWTEDVAIAVGSTTRPHGGAPTHAHARASGRGTGTDLLFEECDMMMRSAVGPPGTLNSSVHYIWGCWV